MTFFEKCWNNIEQKYYNAKYYIRLFSFYNIKRGIYNLITWFPIVWNIRCYDWEHIVIVLHKQLEDTEKAITKYHNHLHWKRDVQNIQKARVALKRILDDNYTVELMKLHERKWGKFNHYSKEVMHNNKIYYQWCSYFGENEADEKYQAAAGKDFSRMMKHADYLKKQDLEYATKIIAKYLFTWWD